MKKLSVIGLDTQKEEIISKLMNLGVVQIMEMQVKQDEEVFSGSDSNKVIELEHQISDVALALETLEKYGNQKAPMFFTRRPVSQNNFELTMKKRETIMGNVRGILKLRADIHKLKEFKNKGESKLSALRPWVVYDLPLNITSTVYTDIDMGIVPSEVDLDKLQERLHEVDEAVSMLVVNKDRDFTYLAIISMKEHTNDVLAVLKQSGYTQTELKGFNGTVHDSEVLIKKDISEKNKAIKHTEAMITGRYHEKEDIQCLYDQLIIEKDKELAKDKLLRTKKTFAFDGWLPYECEEKVKKILAKNNCYFVFDDPKEDENPPVLMQNNRFAYPFEAATEMYALPDYRGFDPTSIFAGFYAMFFGIMLSDAGYGLLIAIGTFVLLKMYDLEGVTYKMVKMFFYCGLSTVFWGAMFGGWFGDSVHTVGKVFLGDSSIGIKPIWFDPITDPTKLLIFSLAVGIVHIFIGMGIKAYMLIKRGQILDAICEVLFWYTLIIGAILWATSGVVGEQVALIGKYVTYASAVLILLTGGRHSKGIGKLLGGFGSLYNVTGYVSDILSYARLLALGLATGVIAQVVNNLGSLAGAGVTGAIIFAVVFVFGHLFNLSINALGAFVHTSRLQYIEFFGKFFEEGGEEFKPLMKNTKYVRLIDDSTEVKK